MDCKVHEGRNYECTIVPGAQEERRGGRKKKREKRRKKKSKKGRRVGEEGREGGRKKRSLVMLTCKALIIVTIMDGVLILV